MKEEYKRLLREGKAEAEAEAAALASAVDDARDITLRGLDAVKSSARVYLEGYTAVFPGGYGDGAAAVGPAAAADVAGVVAGGTDKLGAMEELYGKKIELADREFVESRSDEMLAQTEPEADGGELSPRESWPLAPAFCEMQCIGYGAGSFFWSRCHRSRQSRSL